MRSVRAAMVLVALAFAGASAASPDASRKKDPCEECKKTVLDIFNKCYAAAKSRDEVQACVDQYEVMGKSCIAVQCKGKTDLVPAPVPKAPAGK